MCDHKRGPFRSGVTVFYLADIDRFMADIRIICDACGEPFRFMGVPLGLNKGGVAMSVDGLELRAAIVPADMARSPVEILINDTIDQKAN